jgi:hypothetical protein
MLFENNPRGQPFTVRVAADSSPQPVRADNQE